MSNEIESECATRGRIMAMEMILACLLGKLAKDDAALLSELHAELTSHVQDGVMQVMGQATTDEMRACAEDISSAGVDTIDRVFSIASQRRKGGQR